MRPDSEYRRGTVLGLTIAELFILLVFLLLLIFLSLDNFWKERERTVKASSTEDQKTLDAWRDIFEFHTPDEIKTLTSQAPKLEHQLEELHSEKEALRTDVEKLRNENAALHKTKEAWQKERETLHEQTKTAKRDADQARKELQKGQNPPCWYKVVPDNGKTREKPHYLFNIALYDKYMTVCRRPIPSGRADDDNGLLYTEEASRLPLDGIPYDTPLTDDKLDEHMRPIYKLGKDGKVRSYSCIFSVQVWDKTSDNAKGRWQQGHDDILEELFGTYRIRNKPWPTCR